jgi:formylglycine-generating enzyme required for sulfatase activity/predicted Ser/Thr protein kinase
VARRIGKYELEEYLGGGMSEVYRARDTLIGRTVAVKILTEKGRADGDVKARFLAEARTAGSISLENILGIYDFGEDDEHRPFMVMEYLRGEDLRSAIKNGRTGDLRNKLRITLEIARVLAYLHSQNIVHRDLKPENVHISENGQVKLMDFGISKREGLELTRTGHMVGTPYYMAPEQVTGAEVTPQADVYSFGILLYELIAGAHPIAGETIERIFYAVLNEALDLPALRQSGAPEALCRLVSRCTAKAPAERPAGFGPICAELERTLALAGEDQNAATLVIPEWPPPRVRRKSPIWLGAAMLVGIALIAAFLLRRAPVVPTLSARIATPSGEMVLVARGPFLHGESKEQVSLPAYYIDRTEVTNAAYLAFSAATHHALPPDFPKDRPEYPVVNVTIADAKAFAAWAGQRLPTALQWEKAARGTDGRLYPWGNNADPSLANIGTTKLRPAEDFAQSASPAGALQKAGNVWEFVDQTATPSASTLRYFQDKLKPAPTMAEPWYQIRGSAFNSPKLQPGVLWDSTTVPARWHDKNIGFRCVKEVSY